MVAWLLANLAQTNTTVGSGSGTTAPATGTSETWTVTSVGNFPTAVAGASQFAINDTNPLYQSEIIWVTNVSGTTWTVTRGAGGADSTTPIAHLAGAQYQWVLTKAGASTFLSATAGTKNQVLAVNSSGLPAFVSMFVNVLDYGAVADNGVTDNLAAFNAAASDAAAGGLAVYIPGATSGYGVSADWQPGAVRVYGAGAYTFKTPGSPPGTVPSAGGFYGSVIMPSSGASFTNAVVQLNGLSAGLQDVCVVGNIQGWTAGNAASAHNAPRCIQVAAKGCRLTRVLAWGGLACGIDLGTGAGGNEAQDTTVHDCTASNNLNPPLVINVTGCSWVNGSTTITTTGNFTTSGIFPGMTLSPLFNGLQLGCVVTSVGTTTLTVSNAPFTTNAGPVTLEFLGGLGLRTTSSDCMISNFRTASAAYVCAGGNTDHVNNHWSAGSTTTNWYMVYCQTSGGVKFTGDVFDCATTVAGQLRRDRGIVQLAGCRFQNLNNTGTAIPMLTDNEPASVSFPGALQLTAATVTTGSTSGTPDGYSYVIQFSGSGNPSQAFVAGLAVDSLAVQHSPTLYNGGTPGTARSVQVGTTHIAEVPLVPLSDLAWQEPWAPTDNGLLVVNMDWLTAGAAKITTAGTLYLMKVNIREAMTWTNVWFAIPSAPGVGASTGSFVGLYNSAGTLLSGSADIGATLTSTGAKSVALTSPQALAAGTFVWVAFLENLATTQPTLQASGAGVGASNVNLATAALRFAVNGTGLVALPGTITPGSNTGTGSLPFCVGAT